jgi:hypothetical protein
MSGTVTVIAGAALVLPFANMAGAVAPQTGEILQPGTGGGSQLPTSPIPTITDQTTVEVVVPATGSPLVAGQKASIYECADADGLADNLPTDASTCDGLTVNVGKTITIGTGGTVDKTNYEIYQLPSAALFESSTGTPVCTASSACVLYIGQSINDFTQPFVFSQPFFVGATVGTPTPESPSVIALPVAGALIVGGGAALTVRRRRRRSVAS